jgi:hypothetical protein
MAVTVGAGWALEHFDGGETGLIPDDAGIGGSCAEGGALWTGGETEDRVVMARKFLFYSLGWIDGEVLFMENTLIYITFF